MGGVQPTPVAVDMTSAIHDGTFYRGPVIHGRDFNGKTLAAPLAIRWQARFRIPGA
jgi:hypothetical protein